MLFCPVGLPAQEGQMRICLQRREFIAGLGGAAAWPLAAKAQRGDGQLKALADEYMNSRTWRCGMADAGRSDANK